MTQCEIDAPSVEAPSRGKTARSVLWISCGWRAGHLRREPHQGFPRVQIRVVQYAIEKRGEDLTHTSAGSDPSDGHHFLAADGEVGDLEDGSAAQLGLEAGLDLLLVGEPLRNQPPARAQVGAPQRPEVRQGVGADPRDGPADRGVVPLREAERVALLVREHNWYSLPEWNDATVRRTIARIGSATRSASRFG